MDSKAILLLDNTPTSSSPLNNWRMLNCWMQDWQEGWASHYNLQGMVYKKNGNFKNLTGRLCTGMGWSLPIRFSSVAIQMTLMWVRTLGSSIEVHVETEIRVGRSGFYYGSHLLTLLFVSPPLLEIGCQFCSEYPCLVFKSQLKMSESSCSTS